MTTRQQRRQMDREALRFGLTATYQRNAKVVLATVHRSEVSAMYDDSIVNTLLYDAQSGSGLIGARISLASGPRIVASRNMVVEAFLYEQAIWSPKGEPFEWLCCIDGDMRFPEDAIHTLVARAETTLGADGKPIKILGALCFAGNSRNMYPTIYNLSQLEGGGIGSEPVLEYPRNEIIRVGGTGAAFFIVHREVLAAMEQTYTHEKGCGYPWFEDGVNRHGHEWGEDLTFFVRAAGIGYATHVDTMVKIGHMKEIELCEELYEALAVVEGLDLARPFPMHRGKKNSLQGRDQVSDHVR